MLNPRPEENSAHFTARLAAPIEIGIDCRTVLARKTGDRTYALNLLRGLAELKEEAASWRFQLLLDAPDSEGVLPRAPHLEPVVLRAANSRLWTLWALPLYAHRARLDLVHVQYLAPPVLPCPFVCTIHDVVWRALPRTFPRLHRIVMNLGMPGTARRAARIICGSAAAQADIARYLRVPKRKIAITPYAVEPRYRQEVAPARIEEVRQKHALGDAPYVLSVGVLQPRKNLPRLSEAFARLKAANPDWPHRLVITGKQGWDETTAARMTHDEQIIFTGYVDDDALPALYAGAAAFAYPSLYEGFGYPILEAMACGCPVLTSNRSSMREVAGDAAQLVDPLSVDSIMRGLETLLSDKARRDEPRPRGRERAAFFTTEQQAHATLDVYRRALHIPPLDALAGADKHSISKPQA